MSVTLALLATQFLERPGLADLTIRSYESTLIPLLKLYGSWSLEIIDRELLIEYLNDLKRCNIYNSSSSSGSNYSVI